MASSTRPNPTRILDEMFQQSERLLPIVKLASWPCLKVKLSIRAFLASKFLLRAQLVSRMTARPYAYQICISTVFEILVPAGFF